MTTRLPTPTKSVILLGSALALSAGAGGFFVAHPAGGAVAPAQALSRASAREDADNVIFGSAVLRASLRTGAENRLAAGDKRPVQASWAEAVEAANDNVADAPEEAADFAQLGEDPSQAFAVASNDVKGITPPKKRGGGLTILQIGDSHTAADYFTGEIRRLLQRRFGNGGPGYLEVGRPHPGVRSAIVNVAVSSGWSYSALQKSDDTARYHLSGFDAESRRAGETLKFTTAEPAAYDSIEIQTLSGPEHGDIEVSINDQPPTRYSLKSDEDGRKLFTIEPSKAGTKLQKLQIKTLNDRRVTISGVGIFNRHSGVSYSNVGFPGATIDIVNKYGSVSISNAGIVSHGSQLVGFNGVIAGPGHSLGSVAFTTGALISGTIFGAVPSPAVLESAASLSSAKGTGAARRVLFSADISPGRSNGC